MNSYVAGKTWKQEKYDHILKAGFDIFSERGIEAVQMTQVAQTAKVGRTTLFRYFPTKTDLVTAIAKRKWEEYIEWYDELKTPEEKERLTGAEYLKFFIESFPELYRNHKDILRFNYDFNCFVKNAQLTQDQRQPYMRLADTLGSIFREIYERGAGDGTLNTAIPEQTMFSSTFHIMLSAVTRYAVGLAVIIDSDPERELVLLSDMILSRFTINLKEEC